MISIENVHGRSLDDLWLVFAGRSKMVPCPVPSCGVIVSKQTNSSKPENSTILVAMFGLMTWVSVSLVARWGEEGFLTPLHKVMFGHSFDGVDWSDLTIHYVPLAVSLAIQVYLLEKMPKGLQFFSAAVLVPFVVLAYWFVTGDYNY